MSDSENEEGGKSLLDIEAELGGEEEKAGTGEGETAASSPSRPLKSFTETDEDGWDLSRDEAAEAAALQASLSNKKKRRLNKLADVELEAANPALQALHAKDEGEVGDEDFIVDDLGDGAFAHEDDDDFGVRRDKKLMESLALQPAFQSSSTPKTKESRRRFLCFNGVGSISTREEDSTTNQDMKVHTIELQYTDSAKHKASKFRDFFGFHVAALGQHGAIFACKQGYDKVEKRSLPSTLFFRPIDTWDAASSSEWQLPLDVASKEDVELVAIGETWVAAATNKHYVRILSHTGIQRFVWSLAGPPVTMVGHGPLLAVVFHAGIPLPGQQNLGLVIMDVEKRRVVHRGHVALSPRSKLTWIGFTDKAVLTSMDSFGILRGLCGAWDWSWSPLLDSSMTLKKAGDGGVSLDSYWPVSIMADKLMAVVLHGGSKHPHVLPRPTLQAVTLQLPFLDLTNSSRVPLTEENHARFELMWYGSTSESVDGGMMGEDGAMIRASTPFSKRAQYAYTSSHQLSLDKLILSLFQRALKLDRHARALDLCTMLHKKRGMEIALQMANKEKKTQLATRINILMQVKFPPNATKGKDEEDGGLSAYLNGSQSTASGSTGAGGSRRRLVRSSGVRFEDEDEDMGVSSALNGAAEDDDEGEAEYDLGLSNKKRKSSEQSFKPAPKVSSVNVKAGGGGGGGGGSGSTPSSQSKNPFANKQ